MSYKPLMSRSQGRMRVLRQEMRHDYMLVKNLHSQKVLCTVNTIHKTLFFVLGCLYTPWAIKKRATLFSTITLAFL